MLDAFPIKDDDDGFCSEKSGSRWEFLSFAVICHGFVQGFSHVPLTPGNSSFWDEWSHNLWTVSKTVFLLDSSCSVKLKHFLENQWFCCMRTSSGRWYTCFVCNIIFMLHYSTEVNYSALSLRALVDKIFWQNRKIKAPIFGQRPQRLGGYMAWDITPSLNQIKIWGRRSVDYGESCHVFGGVSSKVSLDRAHP